MPDLLNYVSRIASENSLRTRLDALSELTDIFESGQWNPKEALPLLDKLAELLARESDPELLESVLSALCSALYSDKVFDVDLRALAARLDGLPDEALVALALLALSGTGELQYEPAIRRQLSHASPLVREAADEALIELLGQKR